MAGKIIVVGAAILGIIALIMRTASVSFDTSDDEVDSDVEIATGDTGRGGGGGGNHGSSLENTVTATISDRPGGGDIKVTTHSPIKPPHTKGRGRQSRTQRSTSCDHCGAANKNKDSRCWSCGSSPQATFSSESLESVNKRLRDAAADESYVVKKSGDPKSRPVESPAIPSDEEDDSYGNTATEEDDIESREDIPIYWTWIGLFFGWMDKWRTLTNTHIRSISLVAGVTLLFWGTGIIAGAFKYGTSGLTALIGASLIAVVTGAVATLFYLAPGRVKTVAIAHPFAISTLFLPTTVIALNEIAFSGFLYFSWLIVEFTNNTFLAPIGLETFFRTTFDLEGSNYLLLWFAISFPVGWTFGTGSYLFHKLIEQMKHTLQSRESDSPPAGPTRNGSDEGE
ncbi:hypothetical protein [Haloarcula sp. K1]|uniref:hypothetical protein n=1 Tax=Haloarcula sp. K1 TaxID=1622207 RepID=UPI000AACFD7B|nr:hypothetical protein [Haloarcula sp. K1]